MHLRSLVFTRHTRVVAAICCGLLGWLIAPQGALAQSSTPPIITRQPVGGIAGIGENFAFDVVAAGTAPLNYQWFFNGLTVAGGTASRLLLTNVNVSQSGNYSVTVSNISGSVTSLNAVLAVQTQVPRRLGTSRILQLGSQVGVPIILRANGQENTISFSLRYDTNAYSNPAFLTIYTNAVLDLTLTKPGVAGLALTLPAEDTFRAGYRLIGIMRFDLAAGYGSLQGGLAFATNPVPIAALGPGAVPLQISASIQPERVLSTSSAQLNAQSGLFEQQMIIGNPSAAVMTNLNIAVYGLGADSHSNAITFFNAQKSLTTCPLNDCTVYVECDCSCDFYDPFWGFCYDYAYCSDNDCNTYVTGTTVSTPYAQINYLLPGESRQVTLEFYVTDHLTVPRPLYSVTLADPLLSVVSPNSTPLTITASRYTADHVFLVEFTTDLGGIYYVQYARTPEELAASGYQGKIALPSVKGTGSSVQWIDNGPPKTESRPVDGARFYRVLRAP
ncbi:MAG: immunoglobulin domain-containing protein [Verrucomicrobiota bacterium]